jgi:hypothetical protein
VPDSTAAAVFVVFERLVVRTSFGARRMVKLDA